MKQQVISLQTPSLFAGSPEVGRCSYILKSYRQLYTELEPNGNSCIHIKSCSRARVLPLRHITSGLRRRAQLRRTLHCVIADFMDLRLVVYTVFSYSGLLAKHNRGRCRYRNRNRGTKDGIWTRERTSAREATLCVRTQPQYTVGIDPDPDSDPDTDGSQDQAGIANNRLQATAKPRLCANTELNQN
jgi:hypothetical protein